MRNRSSKKKIREFDSKIQIFMITAFSIDDLKNSEAYEMARIDSVLQKPISFSDLRQWVNEMCKT